MKHLCNTDFKSSSFLAGIIIGILPPLVYFSNLNSRETNVDVIDGEIISQTSTISDIDLLQIRSEVGSDSIATQNYRQQQHQLKSLTPATQSRSQQTKSVPFHYYRKSLTPAEKADDEPVVIKTTQSFDDLCLLWDKIFYNTFVIHTLYPDAQLTPQEQETINKKSNRSKKYDLLQFESNMEIVDEYYNITYKTLESTCTNWNENYYSKSKSKPITKQMSIELRYKIHKLRRQVMIMHDYFDSIRLNETNNINKNGNLTKRASLLSSKSRISDADNANHISVNSGIGRKYQTKNRIRNNNENGKYKRESENNNENENERDIYTNLILLFGTIYNTYKIMAPKLAIFNIHASKSMGTSICHTFQALNYGTFTDHHNCNFYPEGGAPASGENWPPSCDQLEYRVRNENVGMLAQESPLSMQQGIYDENGNEMYTAALCKNFDYMLAFRNPIERAFSHLFQFGRYKKTMYYVKSSDSNTNTNTEKMHQLYYKVININGVNYHQMHQNEDYKGFITDLFRNEPLLPQDEKTTWKATLSKANNIDITTVGDHDYDENDNYNYNHKHHVVRIRNREEADERLRYKRHNYHDYQQQQQYGQGGQPKQEERKTRLDRYKSRIRSRHHQLERQNRIRQIRDKSRKKERPLQMGNNHHIDYDGDDDDDDHDELKGSGGRSISGRIGNGMGTKRRMEYEEKVSDDGNYYNDWNDSVIVWIGVGNSSSDSIDSDDGRGTASLPMTNIILHLEQSRRASKNGLSIVRQARATSSNYYTRFLGYNYSLESISNRGIENSYIPSLTAASSTINYQHFENAIELMFKISFMFPLSTHESSESHSMMHLLFNIIKSRRNKHYNGDDKYIDRSSNYKYNYNYNNHNDHPSKVYSYRYRNQHRQKQREKYRHRPRSRLGSRVRPQLRSRLLQMEDGGTRSMIDRKEYYTRHPHSHGHDKIRRYRYRNRDGMERNGEYERYKRYQRKRMDDNDNNSKDNNNNNNNNARYREYHGYRYNIDDDDDEQSEGDYGFNVLRSRYHGLDRFGMYPEYFTNWLHENVGARDFFSTHGMMNQMTENDWKIIKTKNQWDMRLFQLSQWIADCDAHFYQNYNVDLSVLR